MEIISIIIPCYNSERYIAETISSVKAQSSDRWECIIVDDGSTDESLAIITYAVKEDSRFTVIHTENKGVSAARNLAISKAKGKYILPLDADDTIAPETVGVLCEQWKKNPDATLLSPWRVQFYKSGKKKIKETFYAGYNSFKWSCSIGNSSCFRKTDWERVGGYRDGTMFEDWEFWIRLLYNNDRVVIIDKPLLRYRVHSDSRWHYANKNNDAERMIIRKMNSDKYMKNENERVLVVIPYLASAAQGKELEYAIAGWRKHFKEKYLIVVVGDYHPIVKSGDDIAFILCPRVKKPGAGNYWAHIDHVNKFRKVRMVFPESKGFIYTCDDIYAVRDFTLKDVLVPKVRKREIKGSFHHANSWVVDNYRTRVVLEREGLPTMNWVCHLPVYYEWDKLFHIYDKYSCDTKSRVVEQLYFNTYYADSKYIVIEEEPNDYQFKMWNYDTSIADLKEAMKTKIWISNSVKGWKSEMEKVFEEYYKL